MPPPLLCYNDANDSYKKLNTILNYIQKPGSAEPNLPFQRIEGGASLGHTSIQPRRTLSDQGGAFIGHAPACQTRGI